jgi:hypothetical protein
MAIPRRRTDWEQRERELRSQHGLSRWMPLPDHLRSQLRADQEDEKAYNESLPSPSTRPTSARKRKSKRSAAKAAQNGRGKKQNAKTRKSR